MLKKSVEKELKLLPAKIHDRVIERLTALKNEPRPVGVKRLRGREGYRLRVGDYRVLYVIDDTTQRIEIFSVAHRREVYR
jgi:mRNA interferase RelE/StbE